MKCIYCAESITQPERRPMSQKVLHKALDTLFAWAPEGIGISIHLGSGEPLLNSEAVHEIGYTARDIAKTQNRALSLHVTTNGTLLTDDICHWLIQDRWNVKVSLDGPASIHDRTRKDTKGRGTYNRIKGYVQELARKIPEKFSTTAVLCRDTDPADVFYGTARLGVQRIEIVPLAAVYPSSLILQEKDMSAYREFLSDYVQRIADGESLPILIRFAKRVQRVLGFSNSRVACGAGRNFLAVGHDELIYPCFRFAGVNHYQMGTLDSLNRDLLQKFSLNAGRPYDERKACPTCWAAPLCGGPCFACAELLYYKNGEPSPDFCNLMKADCEAAVWLVQVLRVKNPEQLVAYLGITLEDE
jgi:uncharacterized protein